MDVTEAIAVLQNAGYTVNKETKEYDPAEFWAWFLPIEKATGWDQNAGYQFVRLSPDQETQLQEVWSWSCNSCRDDVGWCKNVGIERNDAGQLAVVFECGHCSDHMVYSPDGEEIGENEWY